MKFTLISIALLFSFSGLAKADPDSDVVSAELKKNADILQCYQKSTSGRAKTPAKIFLKLWIDRKGSPDKVREVANKEMTKDAKLLQCVEIQTMRLLYPKQAKRVSELHLKLVFP